MLASSSSSVQLPPQHQVFINFRGTQLRTGFVSHLESAFEREGINVGIDKEETKGKDLSFFFSRIEESRIAIAIFSSQYTESKWCLDELVKIKECVDLNKLVVIPIFYKVKTDDVTNLTGVFGEKFWELARNCPGEKIDKWRQALNSVSKNLGFTLGQNSDEGESIKEVVGGVMQVLRNISIDKESEISIDDPCAGEEETPQHQVFINFRGTQLRTGFVSHLQRALKRKGINVFMDLYETKGKDLSIFFSSIEESRIALAIFSSQYTESKWCLEELVRIKECVDLGKLLVIPIFYKVETNDVENLKGEFGDKFWELAKTCPGEKIDKWRQALKDVSEKLGFSSEMRNEHELINQIVSTSDENALWHLKRIHDIGIYLKSLCFSLSL